MFHAVSAFCNAGLSTYSDSLIGWSSNTVVSYRHAPSSFRRPDFAVIHDVYFRLTGKTKRLTLHAKIVIMMTAFLIMSGFLFYFFAERYRIFEGKPTG